MTNPDPAGWNQPDDDGVLDDADTLASDDMTRDRLDAGIDPSEQKPGIADWGNTQAEARQGESLDQRLAEEEPEPDHRRTGLGVEPMTCAPNAFGSGDGLIRLALGESTSAAWGLR